LNSLTFSKSILFLFDASYRRASIFTLMQRYDADYRDSRRSIVGRNEERQTESGPRPETGEDRRDVTVSVNLYQASAEGNRVDRPATQCRTHFK
jgi:hypothetical protein